MRPTWSYACSAVDAHDCLDHNSSVLYAVSEKNINRLQRIQNVLAFFVVDFKMHQNSNASLQLWLLIDYFAPKSRQIWRQWSALKRPKLYSDQGEGRVTVSSVIPGIRDLHHKLNSCKSSCCKLLINELRSAINKEQLTSVEVRV